MNYVFARVEGDLSTWIFEFELKQLFSVPNIDIKFCPVVVHILIKDISYASKLSESKNESFWGKIFKFRA